MKKEPNERFMMIFACVGCSSFLGGLALLGWQIYLWLKFGHWFKMPIVFAFELFNIDLSSVYYPQDWVGIAKILQWILNLPLFIFGPIIISISFYMVASIIHACFEVAKNNRQLPTE